MGPYREGAARYFRSEVHERSVDELAVEFAQEQLFGILLAWDAETATGRPPLSNDLVGAIVKRHPKRFAFFASVDPWKPNAVEELERAVKELGAKGAKFHPSMQDFYPSDERHFKLWEKASELKIPWAARFPDLPIIAAHFGWPWHLELIAMALHKTNVYIELSGWSPRYYPEELMREIGGRLQDRTLFGSDYPFIKPVRVLEELDALSLKPEAKVKILRENAARLLKLQLA